MAQDRFADRIEQFPWHLRVLAPDWGSQSSNCQAIDLDTFDKVAGTLRRAIRWCIVALVSGEWDMGSR